MCIRDRLSYDGLFLYFWKQEVWDDHKKNGIQEGDYSAKRGVEKLSLIHISFTPFSSNKSRMSLDEMP